MSALCGVVRAWLDCGWDRSTSSTCGELEGFLAIEDARIVSVAVGGGCGDRAAIDGCAADEDGDFMSAAVHFVDDERHLLGCGNQQSRQTNCVAWLPQPW